MQYNAKLAALATDNLSEISGFNNITADTSNINAAKNFIDGMSGIFGGTEKIPEDMLMEITGADGAMHYYRATISKGSYESGQLEFSVRKIENSEYDTLSASNNLVKMTYDKDAHDFTIFMKDKDGNQVKFTQGKLDGGFLGFFNHIVEGSHAKNGGLYDMKGVMHEGDKEWQISFGTDIKYNVVYMNMQKQVQQR